MESDENILKDLFQKEFAKIVAVLSRGFGLQHLELAEDIAGETFLQAAESWGVKGIPENPAAWLYVVAKRKMLYHFRRDKLFEKKILPGLVTEFTLSESKEDDFSESSIKESQLQMIFAICNPLISAEAQIALALRILCGFGIEEIAAAFLTGKDTINKRLHRAKEKLRTEKVPLEIPSDVEIPGRLNRVLQVIYLLFSEGYYSTTQDRTLRKELCLEAMKLALQLTEFDLTALPRTNALIALMCFHTARFNARQNESSSFILYESQDESLWDRALIERGEHYLELSARGSDISSYHLEAGIAFWHCQKEDTEEKWRAILDHYDLLLQLNPSPIIALNRIYAFSRIHGKAKALKEAEMLKFRGNLYYFLLLGEVCSGLDDRKARENLQKALLLARTEAEKQVIKRKIETRG